MRVAITAATGQLGRLAIAAIKSRNESPVALARVPSKAADLGVETRAFDYHRPNAVALAGVHTLVFISSGDFNDRTAQHRNVIATAKDAGVERIIYTSILKGSSSPMILAQDHISTEAALIESKIATTILRNGWYTENYTGALAAAIQFGSIIGSAGSGLVSSAARKDFAEAIAVTALDASHVGKIYELAGDVAHTGADFAAAVAAASGKPVGYLSMSQADYAKALEGFGLPESHAIAIADSDTCAEKGALFDDGGALSHLIGRPTTPISETIAGALSAL